jgi:hypothetical protein
MRKLADIVHGLDKQEAPTPYRLRLPYTLLPYDLYKARDEYLKQWDELVTKHHGEVQFATVKVWIDSQMHKHAGFLNHRDVPGQYCEYCRAASERERKARTAKPFDPKALPLIGYELSIERRVFPRERIDVPLPTPHNRNPRIQKKWAKQAAGKTTIGYLTEEIAVQMSKNALNHVRRVVTERDALARHRK